MNLPVTTGRLAARRRHSLFAAGEANRKDIMSVQPCDLRHTATERIGRAIHHRAARHLACAGVSPADGVGQCCVALHGVGEDRQTRRRGVCKQIGIGVHRAGIDMNPRWQSEFAHEASHPCAIENGCLGVARNHLGPAVGRRRLGIAPVEHDQAHVTLTIGRTRATQVLQQARRKKPVTVRNALPHLGDQPLNGGAIANDFLDLGVIDVTPDGLKVVELAPGVTKEEISQKTGAPLDTSAV